MQFSQLPPPPAFCYGTHPAQGMVGLGIASGGTVQLYFRERDAEGRESVRTETDSFRPFAWVKSLDLLDGCPEPYRAERLEGAGDLRFLIRCPTWSVLQDLLKFIRGRTNLTLSDPRCPYFTLNDDVQQFLMSSGRTLFRGMELNDLHRLQIDLEIDYEAEFEFPHAEREQDRILAISVSDNRGFSQVLHAGELDEPELITRFVSLIQSLNPDTLEGHNIFRFDLPYLQARADRYQIPLTLGRDGSLMREGESTLSIGERQMTYVRRSIFGRHVLDTMLLSQLYHHDFHPLESFGLKDLARTFGLASAQRTYIPGDQLRTTWRTDPARFLSYALDDVLETRAVAEVLLRPYFLEAQLVPMQLQQVTTRPYPIKLEAILARTYLHARVAFPSCAGGHSPASETLQEQRLGLFGPTLLLDSRPLTTRIMLSRGTFPTRDSLGLLYPLVKWLNESQQLLRPALNTPPPRQPTDEISRLREALARLELGVTEYMRLPLAHCADMSLSQVLASNSRDALRLVKRIVEQEGARLLMASAGLLYVELPSKRSTFEASVALLNRINSNLPTQAWLNFDSYHHGFLSYKTGNYALLTHEGRVLIEGSLLRSKLMEPCLKRYADALLQLVLAQRWSEIPALVDEYAAGIQVWPLSEFLRRETLREPVDHYQEQLKNGKRSPLPGYEAALRSGRSYLVGDQITWYVAGTDRSLPEHAAARLGQSFDPDAPDLNRVWYLHRLQEIYERFGNMVQKVGGPSWDKLEWMRAQRRESTG